MKRDQFTFYRSYFEAIADLPQKEQVKVLLALCDYALNETEPKLSGVSRSVFILMRPTVDKGRKKAENRLNKETSDAEQNENKRKTNSEQNSNEREKEREVEREVEGEREEEKEEECEYPPYCPPLNSVSPLDESNDRFDEFWAAYPTKTGIIEQAYREYTHARETVTHEELMAAVERSKPLWAERGTRYIPSAEKWLHNRGWLAVPATVKPDRLAWIDEVEL